MDSNTFIVLEVPTKALKRIDSGKIRVSEAKVVRILDKFGNDLEQTFTWVGGGFGFGSRAFVYKVGCVVVPEFLFDRTNHPCSSGIHLVSQFHGNSQMLSRWTDFRNFSGGRKAARYTRDLNRKHGITEKFRNRKDIERR